MPSTPHPARAAPPAPLAITMGDACGIGPEIIAMAFGRGAATGCFVVGDVQVMRRACGFTGTRWPVVQLQTAAEAKDAPPDCIPVLPASGLPADLLDAPPGRVDRRAGLAAAACIREATTLAMQGDAAAIVTAPIHKEGLSAAGEPYPGHTELLQALTGAPQVRMMLANRELRTVLVSIHTSLRRAIEAVQFDNVLDTIRITHDSLCRMGGIQY